MSKDIPLDEESYQSILKLYNQEKSYALIYSTEEQCFLLFVHGCKQGYIFINNIPITLFDIGQMITPQACNICIKVICCYGAYQTPYITSNFSIQPYINNKDIMYFEPFENGADKCCNINCSM